MFVRNRTALLLCSLALVPSRFLFSQATSVTTQHNDIGRTGQNLTETTLTPANVTTAGFGRLFSIAVDGQVYAQPLYLPSVSIGGAAHRVAFVATQHDSVYAFDAATGAQLWKASLFDTAHGAAAGATTDPESDTACTDISALNGGSEYGITGTPVIDASTGTLYVVAKTLEGTSSYPVQRLHALDITSGAEKFGGPTLIQASVSGSGSGSSGGVLKFDPKWENQRPGLLLLNGNVYVGFASHCDDSPWHGWLLGYNATTLAQSAVFVATPNGSASGIWMGGAGISADIENGIGRLFPATGNGTYDARTPYGANTMDYGDDILRLTQTSTGSLAVADAFTPDNQGALSSADLDLASGGVLLLPDQPGTYPHLLVQLGKSGSMYVVNRDNMGGYSTSANSIVQTVTTTGGLWGMPAYWNGNVYVWPSQGKLSRYPVTNGTLSASPAETSSQSQSAWYGSTPSISSNGAANGIVWSLDWSQTPAVLYAHNATNVSQLLYASSQNTTRDSVGTPVKFVVPTIADGNVFVGADNQFDIYGLLAAPVPDFAISAFPGALSVQPAATATVQVTLSPLNNYAGTPGFSAAGLPPGVTASFSGPVLNIYTLTLTAAPTAATTTAAAVTVTATDGTLTHTIPLTVAVSTAAPFTSVNMSSVFNVYGIFTNGTAVTNGGLDTESYAYSAALLGPSISAENVYFTFGSANKADAVSNTTVPLVAGNFSTLNLLGAAVNGNQASQSFVVNYSDGTTSTFTQSLSDWATPQSYAGETIASSTSYRVTPTGATATATFDLYAYSFALNPAKTVQSVKLPANRNVVILAATLSGPAAPGFSLSASQANLSLPQNASVSDTVTQTSTGGFTGSASISATGLPAGLSASFAAGTTAGTTTVTFSATNATVAGTYPIVITGTSGTLTSSVTINVTVTPPASFVISDSPGNLTIAQGASGTNTVSVTPANGFTGSVTFAASNLPSGVTASFSSNPTATSSVLTLTASSTATIGTASVTITGSSGGLTSSTSLTLTITARPAASFTLSGSPSSLSINQSSSGTSTITVIPANGFSGSVTLVASGLPSGVTSSFATNPTNGSSVLTLTASGSATTGTATVTITGASGTLSSSTTIALTVSAAVTNVQVSLSSVFNISYGIATNGRIFTPRAGLDGLGYAYSSTLLGTSVTAGTAKFTLGVANGNNAVYGATVALPAGNHAHLAILATGVNGNQASQSFVVTYTDNTTATFTQSLSDWYTPQSYTGETKAVTMAYRDYYFGTADNRTFYLYAYTLTLNSAKTVRSIRLPNNRNVAVLAITLQ